MMNLTSTIQLNRILRLADMPMFKDIRFHMCYYEKNQTAVRNKNPLLNCHKFCSANREYLKQYLFFYRICY